MLLMLAAAISSCRSSSRTAAPAADDAGDRLSTVPMGQIPGLRGGETAMPSPDACIYKMKRDYSHNVPVTMNSERTEIVSYPAPSDLKSGDQLALPTRLHKDYWLDNRGINNNSVFLDYTYEEYAAMPQAPSPEEMMKHILDTDPFTEIVLCGPRYQYDDIVSELNEMIDLGFPHRQVQTEPKR